MTSQYEACSHACMNTLEVLLSLRCKMHLYRHHHLKFKTLLFSLLAIALSSEDARIVRKAIYNSGSLYMFSFPQNNVMAIQD